MKHQKNSTNPSLALSYEEVRQDTPVEEPDPSKPGIPIRSMKSRVLIKLSRVQEQ
jgi:hypothetical protein